MMYVFDPYATIQLTNYPPGFEIECNLTQLRNLRVKICKWSASFSVAGPAGKGGGVRTLIYGQLQPYGQLEP